MSTDLPSKLFLGVDGGQSSTKALVGDVSGRVIGTGFAGPCNHVASAAEGREKLTRVVRQCVAAALQQAGLKPREVLFEAACFGMSGGPDDKHQLLAAAVPARRLRVTHDGAIALAGATAGQPGVVVIAGTGSFAYGRNAEGVEMRAGGWGYVFGDEGSAFDIVRQALRAALRQAEGGEQPTLLTERLLAATQSADPNQMLHRFYAADWPRASVAKLAPLIDQTATEGDRAAIEILKGAAHAIATLSLGLCARLFPGNTEVPMAWVGGVFRSQLLLRHFQELCRDRAHCQAPRHDPAMGALIEAYALAKESA